MKSKLWIPVLLLAVLVGPIFTQQREKKAGPPDFKKEIEAATKAFDAGKLGACANHLKRASTAVTMLRRQRVLEAYPSLGDAFKVKDDRNFEEALDNPMAAAFALNLGATIQRTYTAGDKRLELTVTLDSPLAKTFAAMMGMMAADSDAEAISYRQGKAILKKEGDNQYELTLVLGNAHSLVANARGMMDEELLKIVSQEAIDRIEKAIAD
ncbi:MAG: hypothetical protein JXQ29_08625 [Planctomycetes bacterium]|nr:hypothetical protein [Planctomycetota bacterium]